MMRNQRYLICICSVPFVLEMLDCRCCGHAHCNNCSKQRCRIPESGFDQLVRVCDVSASARALHAFTDQVSRKLTCTVSRSFCRRTAFSRLPHRLRA